MSGGQESTQTQNQTQQRTPYAPAVPGLQNVLDDSAALYNSGVGQGIYGGQRVADFSTDQSAGIIGTRDQAAADNAGAQGTSFLQNLLGSNGLSATTQQGLGMLQSVPNIDGTASVLKTAGLNGDGLTGGQVGALGQLGAVQGASTGRLSGLADTIASGGNPINQTAASFMSGAQDLTTQPQLQSLYARSQAPSAAETNLSSTAAGAYLDPTQNPYVQALAKTSSDNALNATKQAFAASGRYGSGNFAGATTKAVNDTDTALYANEYNQERQNQLSANSQIDAARQAASSAGLGITNAISGVQGTNNQQRLAGAGLGQAQQAAEAGVLGQVLGGDQYNSGLDLSKAQTALSTYGQGASNRLTGATTDAANDLNTQEFNANLGLQRAEGTISAGQQGTSAALQAAGLLPQTDALRYAPASNLLQVGGLEQQQDQAGLGAAQDYFNETQQTPWQALSQYAAFPTAIAGLGGTTNTQGVTQTNTSGPGLGQSILGGGLGLLGLRTSGGGTLGGGLLSSLFASDERLKENIRPVGALADGQTVHAYNYKGDPRTQIGLIAQEVQEKHPKAVGRMPGLGDLLGVDYGRATAAAADKMKKKAA